MAVRTLLFVAGASPQIITETVWALVRDGVSGGEVFVLTTTRGRESIMQQLLRRGGKWSQLRSEYPGARRFGFTPKSIEVLKGADGRELDDVRSGADNVAAADQIARRVAALTRDGSPALHASIAGGRKTMGYLLAAAMMLYGRAEDRLSHVLVHPAELEGTDFFFPPNTRSNARLRYRGPAKKPVRVQAAAIKIELAELPFPRLRAVGDVRERTSVSFSNLVMQLQGEIDVLTAARVSVQPSESLVICGAQGVHLSPVRAAIYALLAEQRRDGCRQADCNGCPSCFVSKQHVEGAFREQLSAWMRKQESSGVNAVQWTVKNFLPEVPKINVALRRCLKGGSEPYEIKMWGPKGNRHHGLTLRPEAIAVSWE
ncbi:MAG: TIGR02584 family CRISPR-associated protein [Deltaproteobacteria bacterium]|nr:TIGR02584 family CRISPR-associated protein [Deltaproteobacteria bacterium]